MSKPPFEIIKDFEQALAEYTGAPFVTCVNSCTMALRLCLDYKHTDLYYPMDIIIPKHTYVSVPIQIKQAGFTVRFEDVYWRGMYNLAGTMIWDSARRFHRGMYYPNSARFVCVSFHWSKILGLGHGGAILYEDEGAHRFFEQMRHDGRLDGQPIQNDYSPGYYEVKHLLGHHCPMMPEIAAQGLIRLASLPDYNEDLPNSNYPDLSTFEVFK